MPLLFDNSYARLPEKFATHVLPTPVRAPRLLTVNGPLAELLGSSEPELRSPEFALALAGNRTLDGSEPIALAYAGHQFGHFVPQLGDGRAILLGEVLGRDGVRYDVQLKGSGRTPFSRGGDGRAAIGPVLREFLLSETLFALGVPTTRSLAAVATGELVAREEDLPGAVLTRVAKSHLRVGTFQYFAARQDEEALRQLVDYALERHYPDAPRGAEGAVALVDRVMTAQAELVARWMGLGFVHGVMNTDNCSIAGETIDYGPCAFLDTFEPTRTFSSIDRNGRYAYAAQPQIALWNVARLAEALLPLVDTDEGRAETQLTELLGDFQNRYAAAHERTLAAKFGLSAAQAGDEVLFSSWFTRLREGRVDFTLSFRRLHELARGGDSARLTTLFPEPSRIGSWLDEWKPRFDADPAPLAGRLEAQRRANPARIPRNHRVEEALAAARQGELGSFERLALALARPYDDNPSFVDLEAAPGDEQWDYRTFCGT